MKIFCFADTHTRHRELIFPDYVDISIFVGDCTVSRDLDDNRLELLDFLNWYDLQKAGHKIFIAGNHEVCLEQIQKKNKFDRKNFSDRDIIYLEHQSVILENIHIFGSPYTPEFHQWAFNKRRDKIGRLWDEIPSTTHIMACHGPVKGILDLASRDKNTSEHTGDSSLAKKVEKLKIPYFISGHIHDNGDNKNAGVYTDFDTNITYINCSCVKDTEKLPLVHNGYTFNFYN